MEGSLLDVVGDRRYYRQRTLAGRTRYTGVWTLPTGRRVAIDGDSLLEVDARLDRWVDLILSAHTLCYDRAVA